MKKMKRIMSLFLSMLLVICMAFPTFAAESTQLELEVSNAEPAVGEEFEVSVNLTANTGISGFSMKLLFNENVLEFLGYKYMEDDEETLDSIFSSGGLISVDEDTCSIAIARNSNSKKTGTVFTAKFKAKATGNPEFQISDLVMKNASNVMVEQEVITEALNEMTIVPALAETGYTVSITPAKSELIIGETAVVSVNVDSGDDTLNAFNTLYTELDYDKDVLELTTESVAGYDLSNQNGKVTLARYGEDQAFGKAFDLSFKVINTPENGTAIVTLLKANVDKAAMAAVQDTPEANYGNQTAEITVGGFKVDLSSDFAGENAIEAGNDYTFTAKDANYDYTFAATMNGAEVSVIDNGDGTYTIASVSGNLVITYATKTAKTFSVSVVGALEGQVTYTDSATYKTDYVFTVSKPTGFNRTVTVEIDGTAYTGFSVDDGTYTIPGKDIRGNIKITVTNTAVTTEYFVEFEGNAAGEASAENMTVAHGDDFTFNLAAVDGYSYEVTAKMGEDDNVTVTDNADGTYTVANVTGDLVITINKTAIETSTVVVSEYVKLDGKAVYLVTAASENVEEGGALSYDGNVMSWSKEYNAYAYLVISDTVLTAEEAAAKIGFVKEAIVEEISHAGDINGTNVVDINDAQVVYNIYNANYADFNALSMKMFHNADINADKVINVNDAAAIVNMVLNVTTE